MSARNFSIDNFKAKRDNITVRNVVLEGVAYTIVRLHKTDIVARQNINNVTTLDSGGWRTVTTKTAMNTALDQIYGPGNIRVYQTKGVWHVYTRNGALITKTLYYDGIVVGGGFGAPYCIL